VRVLGPALLVALLALAAVAVLAWRRAGEDRTAGLREQALGMAEVLRGAAIEAATALEAAEEQLAARLGSAARRAESDLAAGRGSAKDVLARVAREERVGRVALLDAEGALVALVRHPEPLPATGPEAATMRERADQVEREDISSAARALAPPPGEVRVEGLQRNRFATRERFGVAYGRRDGGTLLLRADADALADLKQRFGIGPVLARVRAQPDVLRALLLGEKGAVLLDADSAAIGRVVPLPGGAWPTGAATEERDGAVRAVVPFALPQGPNVAVDLTLSTEPADAAVRRSRSVVLLGAVVGAGGLAAAAALLAARERRRRRLEAEERARQEDERRLAEMGALAALVTHELSNPLNAVRLGVALLEDPQAPEDRAGVVATIHDQTERMGRTLEGYLGLARGTPGRLERVGPGLLTKVVERSAAQTTEHGVAVESHVAPDAPPIHGDPLVLEQALTNLLRNAVLASPKGGRVRLAWERAADGGARLTVDDQGPGFPREGREALLKVGGGQREGGHGLGLPLADRFVRQHHGRLLLEDAPGGGARVTVTFPPAPPEPHPKEGGPAHGRA
jgi:signal transduction histidine kinase